LTVASPRQRHCCQQQDLQDDENPGGECRYHRQREAVHPIPPLNEHAPIEYRYDSNYQYDSYFLVANDIARKFGDTGAIELNGK
jgi:hypothetical protein